MNVLVAGGGIAGPAFALFLRRAGIAATLFEARDDRDDIGGGLSLAPNGMNVLDALGLADTAQTLGTVARENRFRSERGRVLARLRQRQSWLRPSGREPSSRRLKSAADHIEEQLAAAASARRALDERALQRCARPPVISTPRLRHDEIPGEGGGAHAAPPKSQPS